MNLISASNPIWSNLENTAVDIIAQFDTFPSPLPFTASSTDPEEYGRNIYTRAISGEFGPIAPYVPPVFPTNSVNQPSSPPSTNGQNSPNVIQ